MIDRRVWQYCKIYKESSVHCSCYRYTLLSQTEFSLRRSPTQIGTVCFYAGRQRNRIAATDFALQSIARRMNVRRGSNFWDRGYRVLASISASKNLYIDLDTSSSWVMGRQSKELFQPVMAVILVQREAVKPPLQEVGLFCEITKDDLFQKILRIFHCLWW